MRIVCCTCQASLIRAREIDNMIRVVDAEPVPGGELVLFGDLDDEPGALWNISAYGDEFWNVAAGVPRYRRHVCP